MNELFLLYWPTMLAAAVTAAALAVAGAILVTRQAAVQTLAVSQGAGLGVSLGLLFALLLFPDQHLEHTILPTLLGLAASGFSFAVTGWLAQKNHSPTVVYLGAFAFLWALTQLITGFFPVVESHATALYFGDLVTLTQGESFFFLGLAVASSIFLIWNWRALSQRAFRASILSEPIQLTRFLDAGFYGISLLLICFSVQLLGLLFTLACLFLPTALYSFSPKVGVARHLRRASLSAALAAGIGFEISLLDSRFLTTPLIAVLLLFFPALHLLAERIFRCK